MAGIGTDIGAVDYVTIQDKAQLILGTGTGSRGYGQTVQSSDVFTGNQITKAQWDLLRYDIVNIRYHQDGTLPNIVTVNVGDLIGYGAGSPNSNYNTLMDAAILNRFRVSPSTSVVTSKASVTYTSSWSSSATFTLTVTFSTSNDARYFFNSGGKIRFTTSISSGSGTAQQNAWINILNTVGTQSFGADTHPTFNFYTLTDVYQPFYQQSMSTPYSANNYTLEAKSNVANNSNGTATTLYIKGTLSDGWIDLYPGSSPSDLVNGTLTVNVEELKATGSLLPSGNFSITSPSYSLSSITAS